MASKISLWIFCFWQTSEGVIRLGRSEHSRPLLRPAGSLLCTQQRSTPSQISGGRACSVCECTCGAEKWKEQTNHSPGVSWDRAPLPPQEWIKYSFGPIYSNKSILIIFWFFVDFSTSLWPIGHIQFSIFPRRQILFSPWKPSHNFTLKAIRIFINCCFERHGKRLIRGFRGGDGLLNGMQAEASFLMAELP